MKAIVAILSIALVALSGSAIHLWRQLDASRQQVADLKAQVDTTAASARQVATIAPSLSLPLAESTAPAPTAASDPDADRKALAIKAEEERLRAAMGTRRSPESQAQIKAVLVGAMSGQYPDVGKVLGLSRDEVDQLFDLLYKQTYERSNDPKYANYDMTRLTQTAKDELLSLLGSSKYAKWEEYKTEVPTRLHVNGLSAALDAAGTPLSDAQQNSLIQTLAAAERRNIQMSESTIEFPNLARYYRFTPEARRNLLNAASAYLTPQQMETYSQVLERTSNEETGVRNRMLQMENKYAEEVRQGQR